MKLQNPFSDETRAVYLDCWECMICGKNGQDRGGLELHHILGRTSSNVCNASVLCHECHSHIKHNREEESALLGATLRYLYRIEYVLTKEDIIFMEKHKDIIKIYEIIKKWFNI